MKINKEDFKDALSFLWVALVFFLITLDVIFPFVIIVIKAIFYIISISLVILSVGTITRSLLHKKNKIEDLKESKKI